MPWQRASSLVGSEIDRAGSQYKQSSLMPVVWVVVESRAIYTALWIEEIAMSATSNTPGMFAVGQLVAPIIGVTFSLITVRVGLGLTQETSITTSMKTNPNAVNVDVRRQVDIEHGLYDDDRSAIGVGGESFKMETITQKDGNGLGKAELD